MHPDEEAAANEIVEALGPGHYSMAHICRLHERQASARGREPIHPIRLGRVLNQRGCHRKDKWDPVRKYMVKGWVL